MKARWNSLVVGGCNVLGLALLALSVTAGGSAVRAAGDFAVLDSVALDPLMKLADLFQQRVAKIEASLAAIADSVTSKRIAAQDLCGADGSGAQTCITKAQLDDLLKGSMQTAQAGPAPQAASAPRASEQAACPEKCVAPEAPIAAAVPLETPPVNEPPASAEKEAAVFKGAAAPEAASTTVKDTAAPEAASAAVPAATQPPADQQQATAEALAAAEVIPTPRPKPAETAVATTVAKPESFLPAEAPWKEEGPAPAATATTGAAAQEPQGEPKAAPAKARAVSEHKE